MRYRIAAALAAGLTAAVGWGGPSPAPAGRHTPAVGCAAASCHGGPAGRVGGEYATWSAGDPHAKAYRVLFTAESDRMVRQTGRPGPASRDSLCLKCHAIDRDKFYHGEKLDDRGLSEGVGCDACHGPSERWLAAHTLAGWKSLTPADKLAYGFAATKDVTARARGCVGCHVGDRDKEVNHDLIAAGHPRLAFEAARFHYADGYAKHWVDPPNPGFELRTWLIGQVVSLRAACDLLAARAERASPWPELSEASCYSCHRGVGGGSDRGPSGGRKPGVAGWQTWYAGTADALPAAAAVVTPDAPKLSVEAVVALRTHMDASGEAKRAAALATAAVANLDRWLAGVPTAAPPADAGLRLGAVVTRNVAPNGTLRDHDWDVLAQHTLALTAAYHASGGATGSLAAWQKPLAELRSALAFPAGRQRFDSPEDFSPAKAAAPLAELFRLTHPSGGDR